MQVARTGGRKLFDQAAKAVFLEWFAATCNVRLAAAKAGVHEKTVYKHRMTDEAFAQGWDAALQQGYARLEARLLQEVHSPAHPRDADESPSPSRGQGMEVRGDLDDPEVEPFDKLRMSGRIDVQGDLDDAEIEERFDPQLAIVLLREHARRLPGSPDRRKAGAMPRVATEQEVIAALERRLRGFALRVSKERKKS